MKFARIDKSKARRVNEPDRFEGVVHQQVLVGEDQPDVGLTAVFFDDGARTRPHIHLTDQVLAVVEGTCVVADGTEKRELTAGDFVHVKKGEWHWHGAARGHSACHISIRTPGDTDWKAELRDWEKQ